MSVEANVHSFKDDSLDDSLYSRQRYVLGDYAMNQLQKAHIFLSGLGGVGVEIAKNVVLAGPKAITLHDTKLATEKDLSSQFYIQEGDVNKNRALVSAPRVAELNPYVKVHSNTAPIDDLTYLDQFKCVILTDTPLKEQERINAYCHSKNISFLTADTFGAFAWAFADLGSAFTVHDKDGEEAEDVLIRNISNESRGLVTCLENVLHGLEDGDTVQFKEVQGMTELNGKSFSITAKTPSQFYINADTSNFSPYVSGGMFKKIKTTTTMKFLPLNEAIVNPSFLMADFAKFSVPSQLHLGNLALHSFVESHSRLPKAWNSEDADKFLQIATDLNSKATNNKVDEIDTGLLRKLAHVAEGNFSPISAFFGGFVGQEVLKCITGKFTPLNQWLYFDAAEIVPEKEVNIKTDTLQSRRSAGQVAVIGTEACEKLEKLRLFTVGAGAIGCEMMKNYALMGIACDKEGLITITDNDLIEKSNLNRQFLFRNSDIQKPKSECAARAAKAMNSSVNVDPHLNRVGAQTENIYSDSFFGKQNVIVNALDNVAARMYVDQRVVANERPLLESGTLGTKGHVQVILPHKTESYSSQRDPPEKDTPFCTLKSFPNSIDHCIQWARDKFEVLFASKPSELNKFFEDKGELIKELQTGSIKPVRHLLKLLESRPTKFEQCIAFGRLKFQGYFCNNILQLVKTYPQDLALKDGTSFWASPKRFPSAVEFDPSDQVHLNFVIHAACLWATIFSVEIPQPIDREWVAQVVQGVSVPKFVFKQGKKIETDPNAKAPAKPQDEDFDEREFHNLIGEITSRQSRRPPQPYESEKFEKDDDCNHHIDFIAATANLRARNYAIEEVDRLRVKRIAGKIIPAIATTTSVVSGLVALELAKVAIGVPDLDKYRNAFLNLAIPVFALSEPAAAPQIPITKSSFYTLWDKWEVRGGSEMTLQEFMDWFTKKWGLQVNGVFQGTAILYAPFFPAHAARLPKKLSQLVKVAPGTEYVDLVATFADEDGKEVNGPDVRFFL